MSKGKKRFWSNDEKREICTQTRIDSASVAQVARRYAVNANLIHKWLRDPRFTALADDPTDYVDAAFLAVEINEGRPVIDAMTSHASPSLCATRVDLTLSDGRRVLNEGPTTLSAVVGLVEGLAV